MLSKSYPLEPEGDDEGRVAFNVIKEWYDGLIDFCARHNVYSRSIRLQKEHKELCHHGIQVIKSYKAQAIKHGDEVVANHLFHMQCMLNAMKSSLLVWISIKEDSYDAAWHNLVDAQDYVEVGLKVADYPGIRNLENILLHMESSLFPRWHLYNSSGHTETVGRCSICGQGFMKCDHVEGRVYMGRFCRRIDRKIIDVNHVALVENPRDKRCIITKISDDEGRMLDHFTWEDNGEAVEDTGEGMRLQAVVLSTGSLDLD